MDLANSGQSKPQNIIKVTKLKSPGNKLMPLHGSKIKPHKRKKHIINMCDAPKVLKHKCGINATNEIPLVDASSKAASNQGTNIILAFPLEGDFQDSNIRC